MSEREALRVVLNDGVLTLGTLGPVCIYLYRDVMTLAHIARGKMLHRTQHKKYPAGLGVLLVYRTPRYLGDDMEAARKEFVTLMREANESVRAVAASVEQDGFVGAAIRASAAGLSMLARPKFAIKYTAATPDAARWLSDTMGRSVVGTPDELYEAVRAMERMPAGIVSAA